MRICKTFVTKSIIGFICIVFFLGGCSSKLSDKQRARISCVSIDPDVKINKEFIYSGKKQASAFWCAGLIGWFASDALDLEQKEKKQILDAMEKNKIDIRQIILSEFKNELAKKSDFPTLVVKGGDAIFHFKIDYRLESGINPSILWPEVNVWASLIDKNGKMIWKRHEFSYYTQGYTHKEYIDNPELLMEMFRRACNVVIKKLVKGL